MDLTLDLLTEGASAAGVVMAAKRQLDGVSSWKASHTLDLKKNGYQTWALETTGQLGNVMNRPAVSEWVYDEGFWRAIRLAEDPTMASQASAIEAFQHEAERRCHQLEALIVVAEDAKDRWADGSDLIVLDTNVVLRFGDPASESDGESAASSAAEVLDWNDQLALRGLGSLRLVIPWTVLRELDKHKRSPKTELREAAHAAIRRLAALGVTGKGPTILTLQRFTDTPGSANRSGLSVEFCVRQEDRISDDADLEIIQAAAHLRRVSTASVVFVTEDINAEIRASAWGLQTCRLPDSGRQRRRTS